MHLLDFLKVCWYRTCRRRTAKVYPLFKAFRLQKIPCSRRLELYHLFKNISRPPKPYLFLCLKTELD